MERELILPVKDRNYDRRKVEGEIETMKRLLPYIESFSTFYCINDVFDLRKQRLVKKISKIRNAFEEGFHKNTRYYVFCKN